MTDFPQERVDSVVDPQVFRHGLVVAAYDAPDFAKAGADFVCSGHDDHLVFNIAFGGGSKVWRVSAIDGTVLSGGGM
jgi:hypothetical protein